MSKTRDFTNEEDVRESKKLTKSSGTLLKIGEGKTPIYLLSPKFVEGFAHYVSLPNGDIVRAPCGGGEEGKGFAPEQCPICAVLKDRWAEARSLAGKGRFQRGEALKKATNKMRANYECLLIAAKGDLNVAEVVDGKKRFVADYDDAQVGILKLSKKQREDLWSIPGSGKFPSVTQKADLLNRSIIFDKAVRGDDEWATVEFFPAAKPSEKPKFKLTDEQKEALDLNKQFKSDETKLEKLASIIGGGEMEEESEVDFDDDDEEETPKASKKSSKKFAPVVDDEDEEESDDDGDADDEDSEDTDDVSDDSDDDEDSPPPSKKSAKKQKAEEVDDDDDTTSSVGGDFSFDSDDDEDTEAVEDDDSDEAEESDEEDEEEEEKPAKKSAKKDSSDFDDSFLDDVDDDFEDDLPYDKDEEEPALPKSSKKTAGKAESKKSAVKSARKEKTMATSKKATAVKKTAKAGKSGKTGAKKRPSKTDL